MFVNPEKGDGRVMEGCSFGFGLDKGVCLIVSSDGGAALDIKSSLEGWGQDGTYGIQD